MPDSSLTVRGHYDEIDVPLFGQSNNFHEWLASENDFLHVALPLELRRDHGCQLFLDRRLHSVVVLERCRKGTQSKRAVETDVFDHVS